MRNRRLHCRQSHQDKSYEEKYTRQSNLQFRLSGTEDGQEVLMLGCGLRSIRRTSSPNRHLALEIAPEWDREATPGTAADLAQTAERRLEFAPRCVPHLVRGRIPR